MLAHRSAHHEAMREAWTMEGSRQPTGLRDSRDAMRQTRLAPRRHRHGDARGWTYAFQSHEDIHRQIRVSALSRYADAALGYGSRCMTAVDCGCKDPQRCKKCKQRFDNEMSFGVGVIAHQAALRAEKTPSAEDWEKSQKRRRPGEGHRCGFCGEPGHNIRTCEKYLRRSR